MAYDVLDENAFKNQIKIKKTTDEIYSDGIALMS